MLSLDYRTQPSVAPARLDDAVGPFHEVLYDDEAPDLLHVGHVAELEPYDDVDDVRAVLELHVGQ